MGQAIAISGIFAVITSLSISRVFKALDRRHIILLLTLLMIVSGIVITFAHSAVLFMLGRAILGVVIGGFGPCRHQLLCDSFLRFQYLKHSVY